MVRVHEDTPAKCFSLETKPIAPLCIELNVRKFS